MLMRCVIRKCLSIFLAGAVIATGSISAHAGLFDSDSSDASRKIKISVVRAPEVADLFQSKTIAIGAVNGPGANAVAGALESMLTNARIKDRPLFDSVIRGASPNADAVISIDIIANYAKDDRYTEPRTECKKYKQAQANSNFLQSLLTMAQCEEGYTHNFVVECTNRHAEFSTSLKIIKPKTGQVIFSEVIGRKAEDKGCNDGKPIADPAVLLGQAEKGVMDRVRALITPSTLVMEVDMMPPDSAVTDEADKKRFRGALRFAEESRIDRACSSLQELSDKYGKTSLALNYDLGVCEEAEGNAWAADEYFKKADRLTNEPNKLITTALIRSQSATRQAMAQGKQPPAAPSQRAPVQVASASPVIVSTQPFSGGIISADNLLEDKRVALIIGNGNYKNVGRLPNAVNDAEDIAAQLRKLKFEVILRTNATWDGMDQAISEFTRRIKPNGASLFYYAGHGAQVKDQNYILPIDIDLRSINTPDFDKESKERLLQRQSISLNALMNRLGETDSTFNIVILDACRDDPIEKKTRSLRKTRGTGDTAVGGLARMDAPKGSYIAYSTQPGNVAEDGEDNKRNSPFAEGLVNALKIPNLKLEDVMKRTRSHVDQATSHKQLPWDNSSLVGDFFFSASQTTSPTVASVPPPAEAKVPPRTTSVASRSVQPVTQQPQPKQEETSSSAVPAASSQQPVPATPAKPQEVAANVAPATAHNTVEKGPKEFCADRPNFISRNICESRQCKLPAWQNDPFCERFKKNELSF